MSEGRSNPTYREYSFSLKEEKIMKFRKAMALLLTGAMVFTMAGCGSSGSGDSSSGDSSDKKSESGSGDVELSVTIWDSNQEPGLTEIMNDFTEKTGIKTKVSVVKWDEYWTLLESGAQVVLYRTYSGCILTKVSVICQMTCY